MPRFRRKSLTVDAFRLGERGQPTPAPHWFGSPGPDRITDEGILINTLEGVRLARWGDWIIRGGAKGDLYTVPANIFAACYELVE